RHSDPFVLRVTACPRSRGRKGPDRDSHAMHRDDLDLAATLDAVLRCRGKDLDGAVVCESDRPASARADAHRDRRVSPDELPERSWPASLGTAQRGEDPERGGRAGDAEAHADEQLVDRVLLQRRANKAADPEHREETEQDRSRGRIVATCERKVNAEQTHRDRDPYP